jgi:predicted nucleotidyltransferase
MPLPGSPDSKLVAQLRELHAGLQSRCIGYCVIGGLAVNAHGQVRATFDLDVMLAAENAELAREAFVAMGYETLDSGQEISSYVRQSTRLDVLYARRPITRDLLARAGLVGYSGLRIPVIPIEGLLGLKIQAFHDNPWRLRDLQDIMDLVRLHRERLNLDEVRAYFRLFGRENILDDILEATRSPRTGGSA